MDRQVYDEWCDVGNKCHGGQLPVIEEPEEGTLPAFTHRPNHDGESIFWALLHSFIETLPLNGCFEPSPPWSVSALKDLMFGHSIERSVAVGQVSQDKRDSILRWHKDDFEGLLHPDLRKCGIGLLLV